MKRDVLNKISRVINYEESERARLNVYVDQLGDQQEELSFDWGRINLKT